MGNKFEIRKSQIDGRGIFAVEPIRKGELICCMKGEKISISELKSRYKTKKERPSDPLQVSEHTYLDLDEPYVYINHSCDPNAVVVRFSELITVKDIRAGEEITIDYSLTEWSDDEDWKGDDDWSIECNCQSPSCRKVIREFRFLPKHIQKKCIRQMIVQDHIIRKYKKRCARP